MEEYILDQLNRLTVQRHELSSLNEQLRQQIQQNEAHIHSLTGAIQVLEQLDLKFFAKKT